MSSNYSIHILSLVFSIVAASCCLGADPIEVFECRSFSEEISNKALSTITPEEGDAIFVKFHILGDKIATPKINADLFREIYSQSIEVKLESEPFFGSGKEFVLCMNENQYFIVFFEKDPRSPHTNGKRLKISEALDVYESKVFVQGFETGVSFDDRLLEVFRELQ